MNGRSEYEPAQLRDFEAEFRANPELARRARFLSEDLELFLQRSLRKRERPGDEADSSDENARR